MSFYQAALQNVIQKYSKNFPTSAVVRTGDLSIVEPGDTMSTSHIYQESQSDSGSQSFSSRSSSITNDVEHHLDRVLPELFSSALSKSSDDVLYWLLSTSLERDDVSGKQPLSSNNVPQTRSRLSTQEAGLSSPSLSTDYQNTERTPIVESALTGLEKAVMNWDRRNSSLARTSISSPMSHSSAPPQHVFETPRNSTVDANILPAPVPFPTYPYVMLTPVQTFQPQYYPPAPVVPLPPPVQCIQPQYTYAPYVAVSPPLYERPVVERSLTNLCHSVEQWDRRTKERSERSMVTRSASRSHNRVDSHRSKRRSSIEPYSRRTAQHVLDVDDFSEPDRNYSHAKSRRLSSGNKENVLRTEALMDDAPSSAERVVRWLCYQQAFQP